MLNRVLFFLCLSLLVSSASEAKKKRKSKRHTKVKMATEQKTIPSPRVPDMNKLDSLKKSKTNQKRK